MQNPMANTTPGGPSPVRYTPPEYCRYCGAKLVPGYYFCLRCATPYQPVETVLPAPLVIPPTDGERIRKRAPHVWRLFWVFLAVVVGSAVASLVISQALFGEAREDVQIIIGDLALLVTTIIFVVTHWKSLVVQFVPSRDEGYGAGSVFGGIALGLLHLGAIFVLATGQPVGPFGVVAAWAVAIALSVMLVAMLLYRVGTGSAGRLRAFWWTWAMLAALAPLLWLNATYHGWVERAVQIQNDGMEPLRNSLGMPALILLMAVSPAILEEIAFRGLLQHWLRVAISPVKAVLLASALFMAMHFSPVSAPYLLLAGLTMGVAKYHSRSLYPSMVIHFLHNWFVVTYLSM